MKDYQNDFSIYCDTIIQQKKIDIEQFQSTESRNAQFRDRMNSIETELQKKFEEMIEEEKRNIIKSAEKSEQQSKKKLQILLDRKFQDEKSFPPLNKPSENANKILNDARFILSSNSSEDEKKKKLDELFTKKKNEVFFLII